MKRFDRHKIRIARLLVMAFLLASLPLAGLPAMDTYAAPEDGTESSTERSSGGAASGNVQSTQSPGTTLGVNSVQTVGDAKSGQGTTGNNAANAQKEVPYGVVSQDAAPAYEANKGISDWTKRKAITAPANTYVLTAATGASAGKSVLYFAVKYVDANGISRSLFGLNQKKTAFTGVPKVMYAGSLGHFADGVKGDLDGPWIPWLRKHIKEINSIFIGSAYLRILH